MPTLLDGRGARAEQGLACGNLGCAREGKGPGIRTGLPSGLCCVSGCGLRNSLGFSHLQFPHFKTDKDAYSHR